MDDLERPDAGNGWGIGGDSGIKQEPAAPRLHLQHALQRGFHNRQWSRNSWQLPSFVSDHV